MLHKEKIRNINKSVISAAPNEEIQAPFDLRGAELEEDVAHLNAENIELRQKLKQLSEKNHL
jgi:hypothetical protein